PLGESELELPPLEHDSVLVAEHRKQHLVLQLLLDRVPVDIEVLGVDRRRTILQNVVPQRVSTVDPHVVGNEIEQLSQSSRAQRGAERVVLLGGADLRIQAVMINHVITVPTAGGGTEIGG